MPEEPGAHAKSALDARLPPKNQKMYAAREQCARWKKSNQKLKKNMKKLTLAFLKPRWQRCSCFSNHAIYSVWVNKFLSLWCFGRSIRVTQANWAFFFSRKSHLCTGTHRANNETNHQICYCKAEIWSQFFGLFLLWSSRLHVARNFCIFEALVCMPARFLFFWSSRLHASSIFFWACPLELPLVNELAPRATNR